MADTLVLAAPGSVIADFKGAQSTVEPVVFDLPTDTVDSPAPWKEAVALKQAQCRASIPQEWLIPSSTLASVDLSLTSTTDLVQANIVRECGILSERELNITENFNARQLLARMARGEMSSLEVTVAFSKRAAIAQQLVINDALFSLCPALVTDLIHSCLVSLKHSSSGLRRELVSLTVICKKRAKPTDLCTDYR